MAEPFSILILTGSPTRPSRSAGLASHVEQRLTRVGFALRTLHVRDLPAEALLHADLADPAILAATELVQKADGIVIASPVYKAAYTGVLKSFIDLLPQFALRGKVVLPLLTGGSLAHVLALDYALRPVLQSLDPKLVVGGLFVLDKGIVVSADGSAQIDADVLSRLDHVTKSFIDGLRATNDV